MDVIKNAGQKQNMPPTWKKLMKNVDLYEPTSFLDHEYLGCTQRECKPYEIVLKEYREMFESRLSAGATEKYQGGKNLTQRRLRGPTTWKDMNKNALREIANWRTRRQNSNTKSQVLTWMIIISRKRNLNQMEKCQKFAHRWF